MNYYEFLVAVPNVKGKIVHKKQSGKVFIQLEIGRTYFKDRQNTQPKRVTIGKLSDTDEEKMFPNDSFFTYFPDIPVPELRDECKRSSCVKIGPYIIMEKVIKEIGLDSMLEGVLGVKAARKVLDIAAYSIVTEDNAGQYYPDYNYNHALFTENMYMYSDTTISRFFNELNGEDIQNFQNVWNEKMDKRKKIYISYDSTNKNTSAGDISIAEQGKAKDDKGLPIYNYAVAFDQSNSIPLFFETYPGSIVDCAQIKYMVSKAGEYGYRKIGIILDRGYFTKDALNLIRESGFSFIIMMKGQEEMVASLILSNKGTFESNNRYYIAQYNKYGITIKQKLFEDDNCDSYIHLYYSDYKASAEKAKFLGEINLIQKDLDCLKGKKYTADSSIEKYFDIVLDDSGCLLFARQKDDEIDKVTSLMGYCVIVTSENKKAKDALVLYKNRDVSEKLFRTDKTFLGARTERVYTDGATKAKLFVEFIALIIRNRIFTYLREAVLNNNIKENFMTVPAAVKELDKIELVRLPSGRYQLDHAVTRAQKTILLSFGITEDEVRAKGNEISKILNNSRENKTESSDKE